MDYNALAAFTGLGTALVAIYALWTESRRHRFSTSLDLMLRLEDEFSTKRMYANRQRVARAFHSGRIKEAVNEIDEIIDFFEGLGYLVKKGAIDKRAVWTCFFSYMYRFCHYAADYIDQERKRDPTLWVAFIDLYSTLYTIECRDRRGHERRGRRKKSYCASLLGDLSEGDLQQFIREESKLDLSVD